MSTEPPTGADWQVSVDEGHVLQSWDSGRQDMLETCMLYVRAGSVVSSLLSETNE